MMTALTVLLWLVIGIIGLGVALWLTALVVTIVRTRKLRKVAHKGQAEMLREIEKMFGGK